MLTPPDWRLAKPKMHTPYQDDPAPDSPEYDAHVQCEHGGLCPNIAHRRRISEEAAQIIQLLYPSWNPPSTDVGICAVCQASISKSRESNRGLRKQAEDEKVIPTPICSSVLMPLVVESLEAHIRQRFLEPGFTSPRHPAMRHPRRVLAGLEGMAVPTDRIFTAGFCGYCIAVLRAQPLAHRPKLHRGYELSIRDHRGGLGDTSRVVQDRTACRHPTTHS
jgi:hypothetical protein